MSNYDNNPIKMAFDERLKALVLHDYFSYCDAVQWLEKAIEKLQAVRKSYNNHSKCIPNNFFVGEKFMNEIKLEIFESIDKKK